MTTRRALSLPALVASLALLVAFTAPPGGPVG